MDDRWTVVGTKAWCDLMVLAIEAEVPWGELELCLICQRENI